MAGPGHRPARPQPSPKRMEPVIRRRSNSVAGISGKDPPITGVRDLVICHAIAMGIIAPPITKASVGSHLPNRSRKPCTLFVLVMPESRRPAPNSPPESTAKRIRIR